MSPKRISVRIRCCREGFQAIRSTPVDMYTTVHGPLPDPLGCDVFAEHDSCKLCRKYLIELLMFREYEDGSVLDPRKPLPPKPEP